MSKYAKDLLGTRMKDFYESVTSFAVPRRTYTIIRLDGKAFHSYTKGLKRPFDNDLCVDMDMSAKYLCENIQGCKLAYVQSDEITLVLTDFDKLNTDAWYGGKIQKQASVSASMVTSKFNQLRTLRVMDLGKSESSDIQTFILDSISAMKLAEFDSRVFTIPSITEVYNNLIWRQQDCIRNSVSSVAQSEFSSKELHKVNTKGMKFKLSVEKNIDWSKDFTDKERNGRLIIKQEKDVYIDEDWFKGKVKRNVWVSVGAKIFTDDKSQIDFLSEIGK